MKIHNIWYLIRQGFKNVFKNGLMSFSSIGVLVACMLLIGSAVFFSLTINNIVGTVEQNNQIVIYLESDASTKLIDEELSKITNIAEVIFIPKSEGLEKLADGMTGGDKLMSSLQGDENPIPDAYVIRIEHPEEFDRTIAEITALQGVLQVKSTPEISYILAGIKQTVYYAGIIIVAILVVVSLVIITNTIKITIFSRRKEINIMKYVGATDMFIRLPFLVEGVLIGLIAAILAFLILAIGYPILIDWAKTNYGAQLGIVFNNAAALEDVAFELLGGFSLMGGTIGLLSSTVFVRKHLKV